MPDSALRAATFLDKGGVGKTTATAHIGVALDRHGYDVLLLDLAGKQGDLAKHFGLWEDVQAGEDRWPNITTVFQDQWEKIAEKLPTPVDDLIMPTGEGPDLIPAHESLDGLDATLGNIDDAAERYSRLDEFLTEDVADDYDVILLDLPGSTSNIAYNGLWAAGHVVAPVRPGPFEAGQAEQLRQDLETIRNEQGVSIELVMVLLNEVDERTKAGKTYLEEFQTEYPDSLAPTQIPSSQDVQNAQMNGGTLFALERRSKTADRAIEAYETDAEVLVDRLGAEE
ncbi:chromosome partitioning protein [Haloarcula quadrata]|uniref:Chromosome partitioning protein n=1 Tax=Haloarcula quadrata TaxID=182779 RepID=A0A495QML1_9EURY|nr:ParA family protein [Haloarcula quadrata]RKS74159.1 chromosome partitioning protein [Haloarcula quadrata]